MDLNVRPAWWPEWVPIRCSKGHPLLPGRTTTSWETHDCPASSEAKQSAPGGHFSWFCTTDDCYEEFNPPGCVLRDE